MRKLLSVLLALAMCISLFGCGKTQPAETTAPAETAAVCPNLPPQQLFLH